MPTGAARVLQALHDSGTAPCSGEDLSAQLGVSRAQIWKHVGALRRRGYRIEGAPGDGYRLTEAPDRLYPEEIQRGLLTRRVAREIHYFETTESTNAVAHELAQSGAPDGTAVIAEAQTAGRGRLGRSFHSPPATNLYTSLILRPSLSTAEAPTLILAAGVAVAETVAGFIGDAEDLEIKWPNDVLLCGLKTSGILMELSAEESRISSAILGIGVNLNVARSDLPDEFRHRATSLSTHTGQRVNRVDFARRLYGILEDVLDMHADGGLSAIRPRFDAYFRMAGRQVKVNEIGGGEVAGVATGIAPSGALEIERPDGTMVTVLAGDVTVAKDADSQEKFTS
jgi:BirA family biotin operon repressor/biotin-[acetyl-CoA-carboxylase] ligase